MSNPLEAALHTQFGLSHFRPGQDEAIQHSLAGRDTLVVMPTGAGKSLVYQLPALLLPGVTLVVSPLIALMKDQVDSLVAAGKPATFINSALPPDEQGWRVEMLAQGQYKLVYIAPERLRNRAFWRALARARVARIAIDEAHCISQWGHDFRPDYLHLHQAIERLGRPPVIALTATATPQVQEDIVAQLGLREPARIVTGFNRPNLTLEVRDTPDDAAKLREIRHILDSTPGVAIIYTGTRKDAEQVSAYLNGIGVAADHYHAGLDAASRRRAQDRFMRGELRVIVATNAFGMGVDKPDIRAVVHYSIPSSLEAYYQEAGRAGRDGLPSRCLLLYAAKDRGLQEWFIDNDAPSLQELHALLGTLQRGARDRQVKVSEMDLARYARLNEVKLRVGLSQLEQAGAISRLGDDQGLMQIELLGGGRSVDLTETSAEVERRRAHKRHKLAQMVRYAEMTTCRRRYILTYFGDRGAPDAGRCCDVCLARPATPPQRQAETTAEWTLLVILEAVRSLSPGVNRTRLAQTLSGSRATSLGALARHRLYGKLKYKTQAELEDLVERLVAGGYLKAVNVEPGAVTITPAGQAALRSRAAIGLDDGPTTECEASRRDDGRRTTDDRLRTADDGRRTTDHRRPTTDDRLSTTDDRRPTTDDRLSTTDDRRPTTDYRLPTTDYSQPTTNLTLDLLRQGLSPYAIAKQRGLTEMAVWTQLADLIAAGHVHVDQVISPTIQRQVHDAIDRVGATRLTTLKDALPPGITYGQIRCVLASVKARQ